jgi:hypothetical protein
VEITLFWNVTPHSMVEYYQTFRIHLFSLSSRYSGDRGSTFLWKKKATIYQTTRRYIPKHSKLHNHRWENIKPHTLKCRSQWPRSLRHEISSLARTLGSRIQISLKTRMFVYVYSVFVCRQRPCDVLIPRSRSPTDCLRLRNWVKRSVSRMSYVPTTNGCTGRINIIL